VGYEKKIVFQLCSPFFWVPNFSSSFLPEIEKPKTRAKGKGDI
jgi:hypothetical protein